MPERAVRPPPDDKPEEAWLIKWMFVLVSGGALFLWQTGLTSHWDRIGVPAMGVFYGLIALAVHRRPDQLQPIMVTALLATSLYMQGSVYVAATDTSPTGLYSLAANAQFLPLFYIGAFVALKRGATLICCLHYAGLVLTYVTHRTLVPPSALSNQAAMNAHVWLVLLVAQPACIVALHYIAALKGRLRATELASHQGKERFLAMLSHEIRSPLQAMLGSIELLAIKAHTAPERRAINRVRSAATQLDTHLRDVTEYTRLENPAWQLQMTPVDLVALVQDVCDSHLAQAQARQVALHCELPDEVPPLLHAAWTDGARVRQILSNLIGNALKYTPQGQVTVRLGINGAGDQAVLSVTDTGLGIAPQDQARVFEPYVRLNTPPARPTEGSGLGLAVVKRLVERLGATIDLYSAPGQGSCFTVTLPLTG